MLLLFLLLFDSLSFLQLHLWHLPVLRMSIDFDHLSILKLDDAFLCFTRCLSRKFHFLLALQFSPFLEIHYMLLLGQLFEICFSPRVLEPVVDVYCCRCFDCFPSLPWYSFRDQQPQMRQGHLVKLAWLESKGSMNHLALALDRTNAYSSGWAASNSSAC